MFTHLEKKYFDLITPQDEIAQGNTNNFEDVRRCCPICREGNSFPYKKRFHMYNKSTQKETLVHCFNCGYHKSFKNFLKEYFPAEFQMFITETKNETFNSLKSLKSLKSINSEKSKKEDKLEFKADLDFNFSDKEIKEKIKVQTKMIDFKSVIFDIPKEFKELNKESIEYLKKRKIPEEYYKDFFYCNSIIEIKINNQVKKVDLRDFIIIPFYYRKNKNKLYGFQALKSNKKMFNIFLPDGNYKIWNLYDIDTNKTIYVSESIFDAISTGFSKDEIIAQMGISLNKEIEKNLDVVYCLDNQLVDETSYKTSIKLLKENKKVFIWPKGSEKYKDFNDLAKANVPLDRIRKMIENNIFTGFEGIIKLKLQ